MTTPRWTSRGRRTLANTVRLAAEVLEAREVPAFDLGFALGVGGPATDNALHVVAGPAGTVTAAGNFTSGAIDLDPGSGTYALTNAGGTDGYVARYDEAGMLLWGVHLSSGGNNYAGALATDGSGNTFVTGYFQTSVTISRPGGVGATLSASGGSDGFLAKLDPAGNVIWARTLGEGGTRRLPRGVATDAVGNVYVTGTPDGSYQTFVVRYAATGTTTWSSEIKDGTGVVQRDGTISSAFGEDVAVDGGGNVYVTGSYHGKVDFNPDSKKSNTLTDLGGGDAFVLKLGSSGAYVWSGSMGGRGIDGGTSVDADGAGNVYVHGYFEGWDSTNDFNPGSGTLTLPAGDGFLVKLDAARNLIWGRSGVGSADLAVDATGNAFTTGSFSGAVDADPGPGVVTLTAGSGQNVRVSQLTPAGTLAYAAAIGDTAYATGRGIAVDPSGALVVAGSFSGSGDFDPTAASYPLTSTPDANGTPTSDGFVVRLVPPTATALLAARSETATVASRADGGKRITASGSVFLNWSNYSFPEIRGSAGEVGHLGRTSLFIDLDWEALDQSEWLVPTGLRLFTASNDFIYATVTASAFDPDAGTLTIALSFAGGTGRFADATGTATLTLSFDPTQPLSHELWFTFDLDGEIDY